MNDTIDTPTVNANRLIGLAHWLTEQERKRRQGLPSEWNQDVWIQTEDNPVQVVQTDDEVILRGWSCGTAACAAGHIALEDGGMPVFRYMGESRKIPPLDAYGDDVLDAVYDTISSCDMWFGDEVGSIEEHSRRALGLTENQAARLFDGSNDWESMMYHISQLVGLPQDELLAFVGADTLPDDPDEDATEDSRCDCGCQDA